MHQVMSYNSHLFSLLWVIDGIVRNKSEHGQPRLTFTTNTTPSAYSPTYYSALSFTWNSEGNEVNSR